MKTPQPLDPRRAPFVDDGPMGRLSSKVDDFFTSLRFFNAECVKCGIFIWPAKELEHILLGDSAKFIEGSLHWSACLIPRHTGPQSLLVNMHIIRSKF